MTSRRALLAGVGAATVPLAGCNDLFDDIGDFDDPRRVPGDWTPAPGEWAGPGYDQANSSHNPHASPPTSEPTVAWDVEASRPSVVVADGTVFLREPESLRGLDTEDGAGRFEVSRPSGWQHRYVAGRLYDLTPNRYDSSEADSRVNRLHALTLEGEPRWEDPVRHTDWIGWFVEREGYLFVTTGTETIHHHDAGTGERVDVTVHESTVRGLANRDGVLYAVVADGLVAYDVADDGGLEQRWRHEVDEGTELEPTGVAAGGGRVALVRQHSLNTDSEVSVFDSDDGEYLDSVEFDRPATPSVAMGEYWYAAEWTSDTDSHAGDVHAFEGTHERWAVELAATPSRFALAGGTLYVGTAVEEVMTIALDADSGDELWRLEGVFPEAVVGETLYATTADERFVALRE